jgi:small GTP-binding protein
MALPEESAKVVLLGDSGVGKSSLALRLCRNEFRPYSESTIGASFMTKTLDVQIPASLPVATEEEGNEKPSPCSSELEGKERRIEFKIWDTAGQEKYASLAPMYYRGAAAAILVYDISDRGSFLVLKKWADEIGDNGPEGIVLAVCGNKSDLAAEARQIPLRDAKRFASDSGAFYIETSARDDSNVLALFVELGKRIPESLSVVHDENGGMGSVDLGHTSRKSCCF